METWTLDHPEHGLIELRQGFDTEFLAEDPGWPRPASEPAEAERPQEADAGDAVESGERAPLDASLRERICARRRNPPLRLQVRVAGEVTGRYERTGVDEVRLRNPETEESGWSTPGSSIGSGRRLTIRSTMLGDILSVELREGSTVVEFDAPPGSRGARRQEALESSSVKRILYPLMGGLGKAGAAILFLVLAPLLARLLPDWRLDLPNLPEFSLPRIHLPVPVFPEIQLPMPRLPAWEIDLPPLPGWLRTALEYDEIWKPVLIGLVIGVAAVRNHRRSERQKAAWAAGLAKAAAPEQQSDPQPSLAGGRQAPEPSSRSNSS